MNTKGKAGSGWKVIGIVAVIAVALFLVMGLFGTEQSTSGTGSTSSGVDVSQCPSDLTWSGTVNVQNVLNSSATQNYDSTVYFYKTGTDILKTSITDTTSGSVTLTCGETYDVKILSTGTSTGTGDAGRIRSLSASGSVINDDGSATFLAKGDGETLTIGTNEWGTLELRVYDNDQASFVQHPDGGSSNYSFIDGENFTGSGVNGFDVDSGGEINLNYDLRAYNSSLAYNEYGVYILVDADTSLYDVPTIRVDGAVVENIKANLNADEKISYSNYEYIYLISKDKSITVNDKVTVGFNIFALSGADPGTSSGTQVIQVDFAPIGTYASTSNSNVLKIGAVTDSTSRTQVHNLHDTFITVIDD